jgi:hypothetical protein
VRLNFSLNNHPAYLNHQFDNQFLKIKVKHIINTTMKNFIILFYCLILFNVNAQGQDPLQSIVSQYEDANDYNQKQEVIQQLEQFSDSNAENWLGSYYTALFLAESSFMVEGVSAKDELLAQAKKFTNLTANRNGDLSELYALRGFITMAELAANPQERGQFMVQDVVQSLTKAIDENPKNPRAYLFLAQMQFGMAAMMGTPTQQACGYAKQSLSMYEADESPIKYGKSEAVELLVTKCK